MAKIVEITQSSNTVNCDNNGQATIQFNVTNITSSPLRVGARVIPKEPAEKSWYSVEGKSEKKLDINTTDQFSVSVSAEKASSGTHKIHLLVYSIENSDEEYTESETIAVIIPASEIPPPPPSPGFPKWIIWVLVGLVIATLLGIIGYMAIKNGEPSTQTLAIVPDVTGKMFEEAKAELESLEFSNIETEFQFDATKAKDTVLAQNPEAKSKEDPNKTVVILTLANSITTMPDIKDMTLQGAKQRLHAKGFRNIITTPKFDLSKLAGTVIDQSPQADISASSNETEVKLTIANHGVTVPNLKGIPLRTAINRLTTAKLSIDSTITSHYDKVKKEGTVRTQTPNAGKKVKEGTSVKLVVYTQQTQVGIWMPPVNITKFLLRPIRSRGLLPEE